MGRRAGCYNRYVPTFPRAFFIASSAAQQGRPGTPISPHRDHCTTRSSLGINCGATSCYVSQTPSPECLVRTPRSIHATHIPGFMLALFMHVQCLLRLCIGNRSQEQSILVGHPPTERYFRVPSKGMPALASSTKRRLPLESTLICPFQVSGARRFQTNALTLTQDISKAADLA